MYKLYILIDPRHDRVCYVGITTGKLNQRSSQHNNPKSDNEAPIAKLARHLKEIGLKLQISLLCQTSSLKKLNELEVKTINFFKEINVNLLNIQPGGELTINSEESYKRGSETYQKNRELGLHKDWSGENNPTSTFSEKQILEIYSYIKRFYTNEEIISIMNLPCGLTTIQALRSGQNWGHLWKLYFTKVIPSIYMNKNGISPRYKLKVIDLIQKGYTIEHISKHFRRVKTDLIRVQKKEIWGKVWEAYFEHYKK